MNNKKITSFWQDFIQVLNGYRTAPGAAQKQPPLNSWARLFPDNTLYLEAERMLQMMRTHWCNHPDSKTTTKMAVTRQDLRKALRTQPFWLPELPVRFGSGIHRAWRIDLTKLGDAGRIITDLMLQLTTPTPLQVRPLTEIKAAPGETSRNLLDSPEYWLGRITGIDRAFPSNEKLDALNPLPNEDQIKAIHTSKAMAFDQIRQTLCAMHQHFHRMELRQKP